MLTDSKFKSRTVSLLEFKKTDSKWSETLGSIETKTSPQIVVIHPQHAVGTDVNFYGDSPPNLIVAS